ncbi:heavy-metal-associated domain-containing protein [Brevibacillus daliensis]|uniref:heavy-metal-associated domain-containing protein n=1 Tax=Brevibacillus daliensis TaxID=2892995 RepID=UPI001E449ACE|nr:cation transporter [Brevibacillus daliensis]
MNHTTYQVEGMNCKKCVAKIESNLKEKGANQVEVNLNNKSVEVTHDQNALSTVKIAEIIEDLGYNVVK